MDSSAIPVLDNRAIRMLRGLRGATQREVAQVVRISPATLSLLENGQATVSSETLARILAALGYSPEMAPHLRALIEMAGRDA